MTHGDEESGGATPGEGHLARQVRDALRQLHDPSRLQVHPLARALGLAQTSSASGGSSVGRALHQHLLDAVEALRPPKEVPTDAHAWRSYRLLRLRYVEALEASTVQERLSVSKSEYHRDHRQAIEALSSLLLDADPSGSPTPREGDQLGRHPGKPPKESQQRQLRSGAVGDHSPASLTNLPLPLTSFVGRRVEIAELKRLLGEHRQVTLIGAGGCGKTRLAVEAARLHLDDYADGAWLVDLAPLADPILVAQTVALALGVKEWPGVRVESTLVEHLRQKHLLIVLDNCERLVSACAELTVTLLQSCPNLTILATSRERLATPGELTWRVPSLPTCPDDPPTVERLLDYAAPRLFVERARAVSPGFELNSQSALAVAEICRRLDGIPLAIELAAARVRVLSVEQIAARLGDRFTLLTGGERSGAPRQATLRAAVEWSHDLLDSPERALFRRLAVFAGSWSLEAAETICASPPDPTPDSSPNSSMGIASGEVLDLLTHLVDKSLVQVEQVGAEARYRYLETIRQYALERLQESGEAALARRLHHQFFLALAERAEVELWQARQLEWLDLLEREHDNLRTALRESLEIDPEAGLRLASSIWRFWMDKGYSREARSWLEPLLATAPNHSPSRGRALHALGIISLSESDRATGRSALEASLPLLRAADDGRRLGHALAWLGLAALGSGDHAQARSALEEGLRLARGFSDFAWGAATVGLSFLGDLEVAEGRAEQAERVWLEGLEVAQQVGDVRARDYMTMKLGSLAITRGELVRARELLADSLALAWRIGHLLGVRNSLHQHARLAQANGDHLRSVRLLATMSQMAWGSHAGDQALLARAREEIGDGSVDRAWAEGQTMTLEEAIEYALQEG